MEDRKGSRPLLVFFAMTPTARACPACGRPNALAAVKCLYCVAPLPRRKTRRPKSPPVEASQPTSKDWHLLILLPSETRDESRVEALSRIASVSLYDARLSLSSGRPKLFRRVDTGGGSPPAVGRAVRGTDRPLCRSRGVGYGPSPRPGHRHRFSRAAFRGHPRRELPVRPTRQRPVSPRARGNHARAPRREEGRLR